MKKKQGFKGLTQEEAIEILLNSTKEEIVEVEDLMSPYFVEYSMDVIENRALPDVRDGLKPVHRRIMYALFSLGIFNNKPYKKCARVVGEVIGKYNPHGDTSAYQALVKMAQSFYMRYPLVDGHGNFGSSSGDGAAAQRYTECRLQKLGEELTKDLDKDIVDFVPNFDGEEIEPVVLPSRYPNLLCNGTYGIATFTSNIPSHNLSQVIDETIYQIDNPNCSIEELTEILQAPDYPTGAKIVDKENILKLYKNGKGNLTIRSKYYIEDNKIIFTELPTGSMKEDIYHKVIKCFKGYNTTKIEDGKKKTVFVKPTIPEIKDIRDESDGEDTKLIVILKSKEDSIKVLKLLFKNKDLGLQISEGYHLTFLNGKELNEECNLKEINRQYIKSQQEIIRRKTQFNLNKMLKESEIYEGYKTVLSNVDKAVELIKTSKKESEAKDRLINYFKINNNQADSVLKLKLSKLTGMEIDNIINTLGEIEKGITTLKEILNDESKVNELLKEDLLTIKDKYGDSRRTEVMEYDDLGDISKEEMIEEYNTHLLYTKEGYVKKFLKASDNHKIREGDAIIEDIITTNKSTLLFITNTANRYKLMTYELGEPVTPSSHGQLVRNILPLELDEKVIKVVSITDQTKGYIYTAYSNGKLGKVDIKSFISNNKKLQNCYNTDSELLDICYSENDIDVIMVSSEGKSIIFNTSKINSKQSRNTQGVTSMKLADGLCVVNAKLDVDKDYKIQLETSSNKQKEVYLNDVVSSTDYREMYKYLSLKHGNQGNFIWNMRSYKDDKISKVTFTK